MKFSLFGVAIVCFTFSGIDVTLTSYLMYRINCRSNSGLVDASTFLTSCIDFLILAILRLSALLGLLIGLNMNQKTGLAHLQTTFIVFACFSLLSASYSPLKLLALAEIVEFYEIGFFRWSLFFANIVMNSIFIILLRLISHSDIKPLESTNKDDAAVLFTDEETDPSGLARLRDPADDSGKCSAEECSPAKPHSNADVTKHLDKRQKISLVLRLLKYCRKVWPWYLFGYFFLLTYSAARIFIPYYTGDVISNIVVSKSYSSLLQSVFIMSMLSLVSSVSAGLRGGSFTYAIACVNNKIRSDLFRSLTLQEIGFFDRMKTGDIVSRMTSDTQTMSDTVGTNVNVFLRNLVMFVGTLIWMFWLSWRLAVMNLVAMPIIVLISKLYGTYYESLQKCVQDSLARANEVAEYGGHLVLTNKMTSDDLIKYLLYQMQLGEALINFGYVYTGLMQAVGSSRKVFELIDRIPEINQKGSIVPNDFKGRIEFAGVNFAYPSRKEVVVLKNISFCVEPGEVVALVGPSGGGKSSCIALLEHFYECLSGDVLLDGIPVNRYDHHFIHEQIALVAQEPILYARSIQENVAYGLVQWSQEEVERAAILANAHDFVVDLPSAYLTETGERGVQLSGGQKQRLCIARALIRNPKILLLDEATSALDADSEYLVQKAIYGCFTGRTVVLVAHRLSTVERADKIIVIDGGEVVQVGNHSSLLAQDGLYRMLVSRQLLADAESRVFESDVPKYATRPHESRLEQPLDVAIVSRPESFSPPSAVSEGVHMKSSPRLHSNLSPSPSTP